MSAKEIIGGLPSWLTVASAPAPVKGALETGQAGESATRLRPAPGRPPYLGRLALVSMPVSDSIVS
jgi:hypothetical protein